MKIFDWFCCVLPVVLASFMIFIYWPKINTDDAIDAIVGEAANQSYDTMVCVAQGIRHRGTLHGVYGLHAKHNASENADTYEMAEEAWEDSAVTKDQIHGAKNWGNREDMKIEQNKGNLKDRHLKAKCGDLYFY